MARSGIVLLLLAAPAWATDYEVGPGKPYATIGAVPWATLAAGDTVLIYWQSTPYTEKWVICRVGTAMAPITVRGVAGPGGALPVIDGSGATTPSPLNYWNEDRGVIKVGGANTPSDTMPAWIVIENLEIRSARPPYTYTGDDAGTHTYLSNAAAIYVEKGQNITIRNCVLHDCGNGLFAANQTSDLLVEGCYIYDNGITASAFEHNNYTEANGITFQYNRFGPLRAGCDGNNLKDRSAGTVVRYNWIEGGNRQLDLVDSSALASDPDYGTTLVYGNVLIEPDGAGNSQIVHYGGDSGTTADYRKGTLHFYSNTIVSQRSGNTTLFRLSTNSEGCDCRNNIVYVTASGSNLGLLDSAGALTLRNCWFKPGRVDSHGGLTGTITDAGGHVTGGTPGFLDEAAQDYRLASASPCIDAGAALAAAVLPAHDVVRHYVKHRQSEPRAVSGAFDLGAFELGAGSGEGGGGGPGGGGGGGGGCGLTGIEVPLLMAALLRLARR